MNQKTYLLFYLLIFFLNLEFSFSFYDRFISVPKTEQSSNKPETTHVSDTLDMGPCTCNLSSHCDFRCCCDADCSENIRREWENKNICINKNKKRTDIFKCGNAESNFNYNKKEAGITIKDHIFNIMCIQYDNSGDMGNFYSKKYDEKEVQRIKDEWLNNFFKINTETDTGNNGETYYYGNKTNYQIYKADSNGKCIPQRISYLIPFESECVYQDGDIANIASRIGVNIKEVSSYGTGNIAEVTLELKYSEGSINSRILHILKINSNPILIKFKVKWTLNDNNANKNYPYGYIQGMPIKIKYTKENQQQFNENGFFIPMSSGLNCVNYNNIESQTSEMSPILFKNNEIFSCTYSGNPVETFILDYFCNKNLGIGKNLNSSLSNEQDWINLNFNCPQFNTTGTEAININLLILTSKDGEENSLYEYIEYATLNITKKSSTNRGIISLKIKFEELSYSSIINSKEGKITSLIPLSNDTLNILTKK